MKITILNGTPDDSVKTIAPFMQNFLGRLSTQGCSVYYHDLRLLNIKPCRGCFGCWVNTPGECMFPDDTIQLRKDTILADLVIFVSPVIMGFTSSLLKKVQDKMIPLIHPYIEFVHNECHHQSRYDKYPDIALILERSEGSDEEDYRIIHDIYQRLSINMKSVFRFLSFTDQNIDKIIYEINSY